MIGVSYNEDHDEPLPIARPCESCGDVWKRGPLLDSGGARYLINGTQWLCAACMACSLVSYYDLKI
jgi:hypothetical protein